MASLIEDPFPIEEFEKRAGLNGHHRPTENSDERSHVGRSGVQDRQPTDTPLGDTSPFTLLKWQRGNTRQHVHLRVNNSRLAGEEPQITPADSVDAFDSDGGWDLRIITAPMDVPSCLPEYRKLVDRYDIPTAFVSERLRAVTHSFGIRKGKDGSETVWIHFLGVFPSEPASSWAKSGLILHCSPAGTLYNGASVSPPELSWRVTLICFGPVAGFWRAINRVFHSDSWVDILYDPYLLISMAFESWYALTDENAWLVNDWSRETEKDIFNHSARLADSSFHQPVLDYTRIHRFAKDTIFLIEGLEAALRSLERAIQCHADTGKKNPVIWQATHEALLHHREMFHSTRLRTLSVEHRLKNLINLAFNIGSMRDSRIMQQDSYFMRTLSVLAMIFLPISTVSTVFGTQFFSTDSCLDPSTDHDEVTSSFHVNQRFWLLWVIALPMTFGLLLGWRLWIRRSRKKVNMAAGMHSDEEAINAGVMEVLK
ncbi:uncharacterized protein Z518_10928 [Rhinocladiella mackenziei CBS 650.93]|uniref:Uncharacterized protein n=1 Tax=Rhinocladiella mackenziei CBS 650.93 TaxID=1442369 RepID=A0A0D2I9V0_9EURO|nr:uncharacterized protein Z518_10928 [Rhinocladiella mackenziei CBS 650.93]KIX00001.1 hypothetical protein Z518_10928 [Rhinocladiella mackenziei CBS 650.93]